mmetsp:Transcript_16040/g.22133  ORF Transcript_16040/g.22133 Transcript_16040/m.22133 type:complete len:448 (-) Transcript_16040:187-1530(-)|eukprot:CAMPEP_0196581992 /NCGR_PEP_ID=MMETSP1081-20130531/36850_1 /TAXON_ID=36882 /ORGANISM="Pyramimonas amylifera, Strain CCMP720" /LENGTH=447 /DNA_ID=CAMNT_0041902429 /DNA_START=140 /DNA_END=1483 /DNA_ORIENTATION=+
MREENPLSIVEREFLVSALREQQRVDGRRPFDSRRLTLRFLTSERSVNSFYEGPSVEARLGPTRVLAGVRAELVTPAPERPHEGTLALNVEISSIASPSTLDGPRASSSEAVEVGRLLERSVRESGAVDTEALCVLAGRKVWALTVVVQVLDHGGSLMDACSVGALMALLAFRHPDVSVGGGLDESEVVIHSPAEKEAISLHVHHLPLALSFAFLGVEQDLSEDLVVLDPSLKEEAAASARLTLCINTNQEICALHKPGGAAISPAQLMRCARIAGAQASERTAIMKGVLSQYETEKVANRIRRKATQANTGQGNGEDALITVVPRSKTEDVEMEGSEEEEVEEEEEESEDESEEDEEDEEIVAKSSMKSDWRNLRPPVPCSDEMKQNIKEVKKEDMAEFDTFVSLSKAQKSDKVVVKIEDDAILDLTAAIKVPSKGKKKGGKRGSN